MLKLFKNKNKKEIYRTNVSEKIDEDLKKL